MQDELNEDLLNLQNWLHDKKLSINVVKTLAIGSRSNIHEIEKQTEARRSFEIGDQKINMITEYLGVQIDDKLQWDRHIEKVKAKALRDLGSGLLKHSKKFLPIVELQEIYRGIVEPHFGYCCSVWGCCSDTKLNALQKIQNRAAKIVPKMLLLLPCSKISMKDPIKKEAATLTYNAMDSSAPQYLREPFWNCSEGNVRIIRSTERYLQIPLLRTCTCQKGFL